VAGHQITPSDQVDQVWHLQLQLLAVRLLQYRPPMRPLAAARCSQPGHLGELKAHPPPERVSQSAGDGRHERAVQRCAGPMGSSTVAGTASGPSIYRGAARKVLNPPRSRPGG
jgi:hypothetical protein